MTADFAIIGGGIVGLSIGWGLARRGKRVIVLDGGDGSYRASRGNFGLIWVQSKGLKNPQYARWSQQSAALWKTFAADLAGSKGNPLDLHQNGGWDYHFTDDSLAQTSAAYSRLRDDLDGDYPFEILGHNAVKSEEPNIGPGVVGAILHAQDGHVNPLRLLMTLSREFRALGGVVHHNVAVDTVTKTDQFNIIAANGASFHADQIVISAGLGAIELGPKLGFVAPIRPQRGQVLITQKLPKIMNRPSGIIRQVGEGGIQIGATNEEVGFDDHTTGKGLAALAAQAIAAFPALARAQLVRSWAALRIMSPDGYPIYQHSDQMPGAYLVTCHSAITLAAVHAMVLPDWLLGTADAPDLKVFDETRFS